MVIFGTVCRIMCTVKSRPLAALVDKPQVYFLDVVKCVNEVYAHRDDTFSAAHCLECASPKWMNLCTWIAWEIWHHRLTDRPTARVPWADHRPSRVGVQVGWI